MVWLRDGKLHFDEVRVAWAFCVVAALISYFGIA
jgi:hypothetical protein